MSGKKVAVFGIYSTALRRNARITVKVGFPTSEISVLLPESLGGRRKWEPKRQRRPEGRQLV